MSASETPGGSLHFIVVDDHPLFREALATALTRSFLGARVEETGSIEGADQILSRSSGVDLMMLDLSLDRADGFEGLTSLRKRFPFVPILIVSGVETPGVAQRALRLGAAGFVPKAADKAELRCAVSSVLSGEVYVPRDLARSTARAPSSAQDDLAAKVASLTPAQTRVLSMLRRGLLNKEIAEQLGVGESTVKSHVTTIFRKLGVISRTQVVIKTAQLDLEAFTAAEH